MERIYLPQPNAEAFCEPKKVIVLSFNQYDCFVFLFIGKRGVPMLPQDTHEKSNVRSKKTFYVPRA